ncbi:hypothetical protein [Aureimonas phyllosphaerae]|uniref:Core-2/I-Branching enzyme n=1 Tax=Aureimonas phyllosphaerae TaxID=1166078 RepID=A0A7W6FWK6_9HYPH|nr:hypothetical protein [Aureimonas phyllosphaerae]MBB3938025.1 hypothetical protein [Aureimonas phyllosphaerae]MBB3962032.1 hypothetical protein [Aureimonas phyllosphaerae]SFF54053.1 hypothetical protein SAMN05216566_12432 [Aureimonas phyllosphaerae]
MTPLFLVQSHNNPAQLVRLATLIRTTLPQSVVLFSHDVRAAPLDKDLFGKDDAILVTQGQGGRGDFAILDGYLDALRFLRREGIRYDWLTNLSAQDYPVHSLEGMVAVLAAAEDHDGFLHHFDALAQDPDAMAPMAWPAGHGYERYHFQYAKLKDRIGTPERAMLKIPRLLAERFPRGVRINTAYGLMVGRHAANAPFDESFRCHAGSYWHTIRARCAEYLLDFAQERPDVVAYFRKVLIPDESFIQTVLMNNPAFRFEPRNRRYFDMRGSRHGHPQLLTAETFDAYTDGRFFFARKFAPGAANAGLFDRLDRIARAPAASQVG